MRAQVGLQPGGPFSLRIMVAFVEMEMSSEGGHMLRRLGWALLLLCATVDCKSDLGDGPNGASVRGEVRYEGEAAKQFDRPLLLVTADTLLDSSEDRQAPYSLTTLRDVDLSKPIPYELRLLPPGRYFLVALIGDESQFDPNASPLGSYPNTCVLAQMPASRSIEIKDEDEEGVDIVVRDILTADPCFGELGMSDGGTPEGGGSSGNGAVEVHLAASGLSPAKDDTLTVSLFDESPLTGGQPTYTEVVTGPSFPTTVTIENVAVGDYTVIVCFQEADSTSATCMGAGDRTAFYPSLTESVDVVEGETTSVDVML